MTKSATTLDELIAAGSDSAAALSAPGGVALTYANLRRLAADTRAALNAHGVGRNDRVAIVLDNGPEMAAAFVAIASGTTSAPLNPGYRADEFEFYLTDLNARVLVAEQGKDSPAVEVARKLKLPVVRLVPTPQKGAGGFTLEFPAEFASSTPADPGTAQADDVALVLHTSGTTSRPKIVPLSQRNVVASAHHISTTLSLTPDDSCLN